MSEDRDAISALACWLQGTAKDADSSKMWLASQILDDNICFTISTLGEEFMSVVADGKLKFAVMRNSRDDGVDILATSTTSGGKDVKTEIGLLATLVKDYGDWRIRGCEIRSLNY